MIVSSRSNRHRRARHRFRRIFLEQLEDRSLLAATITVNSVLDTNARDNDLTLREATLINNRTLSLASLTPFELAQVAGTPSATDADTIQFNIPGSGVQTIVPTTLLTISDPVVIDGYSQPGATPNSDPNGFNGTLRIELKAPPSPTFGVILRVTASNSLIRGLVINGGGLTTSGISISGSNDIIRGNFLGTDATGSASASGLYGVDISAGSGNIIGGSTPPDRNVISGNFFGIRFVSASTIQSTIVRGNFIGTDKTGQAAIGNSTGIAVLVNAVGTTIGGPGIGDGNLISGNTSDGISLGGTQLSCSSSSVGNSSTANVIQGNKIGTDISGILPLGNGKSGIAAGSQIVAANTIGGTGTGEGNIIAFNGMNGVAVLNSVAQILSNSIFSNTQLGIHLGPIGCGQTPNDPGDADTGPNNLQNFPEISSAKLGGPQLSLQYVVPSTTTNSAYPLRVEFFKADSSGQEGQVFLGSDIYASAEAGTTKTISFTAAATLTPGDTIIATATDSAGNTSEFGSSIGVVVANVTAKDDSAVALEDTQLTVEAPGVLGNDSAVNGAPLTAIKDSNPLHGTVVLNSNGGFIYTPNANYIGPDSFTYHASNGTDNSSTATVSLTVQGASISGTKWNDLNGNGVRDPGEPGLGGVTITLDAGANGTTDLTTVTDATGNYSFTNLNDGVYGVAEVVPTGWQQTYPLAGIPANFPIGKYQPAINPTGTVRLVPAAYSTIQSAIDAAVAGDTVLVSPGTYIENINFHGKAISVTSASGPDLTIIDGNQKGPVATFASGETSAAHLHGFTLRNGRAQSGSPDFGDGGGIRIAGAPTITSNKIVDNFACTGAGMSISFSSPTVSHNVISRNTQSGCSGGVGGGGIMVGGAASASTQIVDNLISDNITGAGGGGIAINAGGNLTVRGNIIRGNSASTGGGIAMTNDGFPGPRIVQNLIVENQAGQGGGIYTVSNPEAIVNNTIAGNSAPTGSGIDFRGFYLGNNVLNNVVIGKTGQSALTCEFTDIAGAFAFKSNDVFNSGSTAPYGACTNLTGSNGNTSVDPLFINPAASNYHFQSGSPAIDVGLNTAIALPSTDLDGRNRILDGDKNGSAIVDLGVYEFDPQNPGFFTLSVGQSLTGVDFGNKQLNQPPVANPDSYTTSESTLLSVTAPGVLANDTDPNAVDSKTVVAVNGQLANVGASLMLASGALLQAQANGSFTYDPNGKFESLRAGQSSTDSFIYTMADSQAATSSATVTITLQGANDAPVAVNDSASVGENGLLSVPAAGLLANDTDVDAGDTKAIVAVNGQTSSVSNQILLPSGALLKVQANGSYTYNPNGSFESLAAGQTTTDSFTYKIADSQGATSTATVTITITGANDAPVAVGDTAAVGEDQLLMLTAPGVLANDTDVDQGDTLTVVAVNGQTTAIGTQITLASGALATVNADGSVSYDPNGKFEWLTFGHSTTDSFSYTAGDGLGATKSAIVTIAIQGENDAPVAVDDAATVAEDDVLSAPADGLLSNDTDPDVGDTRLLVAINGQSSLVGTPMALASGALLIARDDGSYQYDPNGAFEWLAVGQTTIDSFTYTVADSQGATSSAKVLVTIQGTNDPPVAADDVLTTGEDDVLLVGPAGILQNDVDPDAGDTATVTAINGDVGAVGTQLTLTSGAQLFVAADGSYRYDPTGVFESLAVGHTATDSFTYTMADSQGATSSAMVVITIEGANDAPLAADDALTTGEGQAIQADDPGLLLNDTDIDSNDTMAVIAVNGLQAAVGAQIMLVSGALLTVQANGSYRYDPNASFESLKAGGSANDYFTYTIADGSGAMSTALATITIHGANDAPVATNDNFLATEDNALSITAPGVLKNDTDVESDKLSAIIDRQPMHGTIDFRSDGGFRYSPILNYNGPDSFTYHASDGSAISATVTVALAVQAVNDAPVATNDTFSGVEDAALNVAAPGLLANDTDVDSSGLTAVPVTPPLHGKLILHLDGSFIYTPDDNYNGPDSFTYQASDGQAASNIAAVSLSLAALNDPPTVSLPGDVTLNEGSMLSTGGSIADPDSGDSWTATVDYGDGGGQQPLVLAGDKSFQLGHLYRDNGTYTIVVAVQDAARTAGTATFHAIVKNVAPQNLVWYGSPLAARNQAVQFAGSFSDPGVLDTQTATIDWGDGTTGPASLSGPAGQWQAKASHAYSLGGLYPVTLKVSDKDGGVATATCTVMIVGTRLNHGTLEIVGTSQQDTIRLSVLRNNLYINGTLGGAPLNLSYSIYGVQRIVANLGDGNDSLTVDAKIKAALLAVGGNGNDKITAGGGPSVLVGGAGQDQLSGGAKSDLLIGGTTAYDNNPAALAAILAEWSSSRTLAARSANLRAGIGSGSLLQGIDLTPNETVFDDGVVDTLMGGGDLDWFLCDAKKDKLKDKAAGDLLN